jgi:hypothetical protein
VVTPGSAGNEGVTVLFGVSGREFEHGKYWTRRTSNQGVGGSNPSGRTKIKDLDAGFFGAVLIDQIE